jgi:hypothetical protein
MEARQAYRKYDAISIGSVRKAASSGSTVSASRSVRSARQWSRTSVSTSASETCTDGEAADAADEDDGPLSANASSERMRSTVRSNAARECKV